MSAKKGSSAKGTAKSTKPATNRSLRDLEMLNDKSKNIKGGVAKKVVRLSP